MGPVGWVWLVVSVGLGAFLGAFFLCRICFLRGFLGFKLAVRLLCLWIKQFINSGAHINRTDYG